MSMSRTSGSKKTERGGLEDLAGRWRVSDVPPEARAELLPMEDEEEEASRELRGVVLGLEAQGEVSWEVPPGAPDGVLLFETNSAHLHKNSLTFLGGAQGWSLTFKVRGEPEQGWMVLESDAADEGVGFSLSLAKEKAGVAVVDDYFSLGVAVEAAFFSDVTLCCTDGVELPAHRAILIAAYPTMQEADWLALFRAQPCDLGRLLLTTVYSDCLPQDLTVPRAKQLLSWVEEQPKLERLQKLISAFIEANNLKQKLICLIDELLALLQEAKRTVSSVDMADPVKVKYTIKQLSKDTAVGGAKFGLLCQLYTGNRKQISKADNKMVLEYLRARVVVFMDLLRELAQEAVQKWEALSQDEQMDVALELIPDVEQVWDLFLKHGTDLKASLASHPLGRKSGDLQTKAGVSMALHLISRGSEVKRLLKIRKEFLESVEMAQGKRDRWEQYSEEEKAGQVLNVVGKMVNEAGDLQESMETRKRQLLLDNGLEWRAFRSYVDIACMYMTWGLHKTLTFKDSLKPLLLKALKFVGRSEVNEATVYLGLLGRPELEEWLEEVGGELGSESSSVKLPKPLSRMPGLEPRRAGDSALARGCLQLATSQHHTDMEFELDPAPHSTEGREEGSTVIPAHRVIVASRCQWACRALQSGMKEALERRIVVSGVEEDVFRLFLQYLYGAPLDAAALATDTLVDLMAVADRFETPVLLQVCESLLVERVDDSSVFQLLEVAELYHARHLREASLQRVLTRPEVIMQEVEGYSSLSEGLREELRELLSGTQDPTLALRHSRPAPVPPQATPTSPPVRGSASSGSGASSDAEEEFQLEPHTLQWEAALEELRAVVGSEVGDDMLRDLLLAADMDVNRAVNFYFNTLSS